MDKMITRGSTMVGWSDGKIRIKFFLLTSIILSIVLTLVLNLIIFLVS